MRQISGILVCGNIGDSKGRYGITDVPVPPVIKLLSGGPPFWCLIRFEKINNKLVEFLVVEPIVMACPMVGIAESKMQLSDA